MSTNNFNLFILFFIIYCRTITLAFNDFKFDYGGGTRVYDQTPPKNTKYFGSPKQERSTASSSYGQAINFGQNGQQIRDVYSRPLGDINHVSNHFDSNVQDQLTFSPNKDFGDFKTHFRPVPERGYGSNYQNQHTQTYGYNFPKPTTPPRTQGYKSGPASHPELISSKFKQYDHFGFDQHTLNLKNLEPFKYNSRHPISKDPNPSPYVKKSRKLLYPPKEMHSNEMSMMYNNKNPMTKTKKHMSKSNNHNEIMSSTYHHQNSNKKPVYKQQAAVLPEMIDLKASPIADPPAGSFVPAHIGMNSAGKGNRHGIAAAAVVRRRPSKKRMRSSSKKPKKPLAGKAMMSYKRRQKNPYAYGRK